MILSVPVQLLVKTHRVEAIGWTEILNPSLEVEEEGCNGVPGFFCSELRAFYRCFAAAFFPRQLNWQTILGMGLA